MLEFMFRITPTKVALAAAVTAVALSQASCASPEEQRANAEKDRAAEAPAGRYAYDFNSYSSSARQCLLYTPYTSSGSRSQQEASLEYDPESQVMTVTPNTGTILRVTGFNDPTQPLSPADKPSLNILDTYACDHGPLIEIPYRGMK
jgi:hypothetical protein